MKPGEISWFYIPSGSWIPNDGVKRFLKIEILKSY